MAAILERIVEATRARVAKARRVADFRELERQAEMHAPRGFRRALGLKSREGVAGVAEVEKEAPAEGLLPGELRPGGVGGGAVGAEWKEPAPWRGLIGAEFRPGELARELEAAGAAALSALTDEEFFQGSLENLQLASGAVSIPCLRKDFIVDEFQLTEARANAADAVLLIVAALSAEELSSLAAGARRRGLDVLCEVHDGEELQRALDAGCNLIGVNTRDLRTFQVDQETAFALAARP